MIASCDTTLVPHEAVTQGPLVFELWVTKELCVQPMPETTMFDDGPLVVRVTNKGPNPAQLVAADPEALFVTRLWDADRPASPLEMKRGPEPEVVPMVTVEIAPGDSWQSAPIKGYVSRLVANILEGTYFSDGTSLDPASKLRRVMGLEVRFAATINTGAGFVASQQLLKGSIEVVLLPQAQ